MAWPIGLVIIVVLLIAAVSYYQFIRTHPVVVLISSRAVTWEPYLAWSRQARC